MPRTITYSLRLEQSNSDGYYRSISAFTDRWTPSAITEMKEIISEFHAYRHSVSAPTRSEAEYALELLTLGVLLNYSPSSSSMYPPWVIQLLVTLNQSQTRLPKLEPVIKNLRGFAQGIFFHLEENGQDDPSTWDGNIDSLLRWLKAQGENAVLKRLAQWQAFLLTLELKERQSILDACLSLANRFAQESDQALGEYSKGVNNYLENRAPKHRWQYDSAFVSRNRVEYHLGMLATETLNRAYRQRFLSTHKKVVIVPPCMREQPDEDCKALETPFGARCQACKPNCRVHHVTKLGEKMGFEVFIIPDELRGIGSEAKKGAESIGLVGVSCALTNWTGGWDAEELGVPAQGVLLDYVGCHYHWDDKGISTDTNLSKLKEIVGI